jgi:PAS domain S-box-containing protein
MLKLFEIIAVVGFVVGLGLRYLEPRHFIAVMTVLLSVWFRWFLRERSAYTTKASTLHAIRRQDATTWEAIFQNSYDPILAFSGNGIILAANKAVTKTFAYQSSELIGRNVSMLIPPETLASVPLDTLAGAADTHLVHVIGVDQEVQAVRKNGTLLDMEVAVTQAERDGHPVYIAILRDLSQRRESERAAAIVKARSEFVAGISHEARRF